MRKIKFYPGIICHIYNRGTDKRNIFNCEADMWRFLQGMYLFNDEKSSFGVLHQIEKENNGKINFNLLTDFINNNKKDRNPLVKVIADCLMPNHFHLILQEIQEGGLSSFMHKLGTGYSNYFNKKYKRSGVLFEGPYKAVEIKNDLYLTHLLVYINILNPGQLMESELKEKGVQNINKVFEFAKKYSFSTNLDYLGLRNSIVIDKGILGEIFDTPEKYENFARESLLSKNYSIAESFAFEN